MRTHVSRAYVRTLVRIVRTERTHSVRTVRVRNTHTARVVRIVRTDTRTQEYAICAYAQYALVAQSLYAQIFQKKSSPSFYENGPNWGPWLQNLLNRGPKCFFLKVARVGVLRSALGSLMTTGPCHWGPGGLRTLRAPHAQGSQRP